MGPLYAECLLTCVSLGIVLSSPQSAQHVSKQRNASQPFKIASSEYIVEECHLRRISKYALYLDAASSIVFLNFHFGNHVRRCLVE